MFWPQHPRGALYTEAARNRSICGETGSAVTGNPGTPCDEHRAIFVAAAGSDGRPHSNDETRPPRRVAWNPSPTVHGQQALDQGTKGLSVDRRRSSDGCVGF